jgi:hypothetical protein
LRWLNLMLLVPIPWAGHVWALPFLTALAPSARYFEERKLVLVADGGFAALELLNSLSTRSVICVIRMRLDARLFNPAPPRKKGAKGGLDWLELASHHSSKFSPIPTPSGGA